MTTAPNQTENPRWLNELAKLSRLGDISVALTVFDRLVGNEDLFKTPLLPDEKKNGDPAEWDLNKANQVEEWLLLDAQGAIKLVLETSGLRIAEKKKGCIRIESKNAHGKWAPLTRKDAYQGVFTLEKALGNVWKDLDEFSKQCSEIASKSLQTAGKLLAKTYKGLSGLSDFKMRPLDKWDASVYGMSATDMGLISAYTGFMTSANSGIITMPNFTQWDANSEFVEHKLRFIEKNRRSIPRLWRYMYMQCFRAPCHEVIHCAQHVCGQKMETQVAEHDAYYSCNVLAHAVSLQKEVQGLIYPGLAAEILMASLEGVPRKLINPPKGWCTKTYHAWRDAFGVAPQCWDGKKFGSSGDLTKSFEFIAGPMVTLEACMREGKRYTDSEVEKVVDGLVRTAFEARDAATHKDAKYDDKAKRKILDCNKLTVKIDDIVDLKGMTIEERLKALSAPIGSERAEKLIKLLS